MSRVSDEKQYKSRNGSSGTVVRPKKKWGTLITYSPTKEDKERLRSGALDETKALEVLERVVQEGNRLSLGYSTDRNGYFAITRQGDVDFEEAISLSVWGGSLSKCVLLLGYYHREVNPDFPENVQLPMFEDEW